MQNGMLSALTLVLLLLTGNFGAFAQETENKFEMREDVYPALWSGWIEPDAFMQTLAELVDEYEQHVGGPCRERFTIDADISRQARDQFSQKLRRNIGAEHVWRLNVSLEKCGRMTFTGLAFSTDGNRKMQIALFGPGKLASDRQLQNDIAKAISLISSTLADREDCPSLKNQPLIYFDREVSDASKMGDAQPQWIERWAVPVCGKIAIFQITYQTNEKGAAFGIQEEGITDPVLFTVTP